MTKIGTKCTAHEKLEFYLKNPDKNKSFLQNEWPNDCDEVLKSHLDSLRRQFLRFNLDACSEELPKVYFGIYICMAKKKLDLRTKKISNSKSNYEQTVFKIKPMLEHLNVCQNCIAKILNYSLSWLYKNKKRALSHTSSKLKFEDSKWNFKTLSSQPCCKGKCLMVKLSVQFFEDCKRNLGGDFSPENRKKLATRLLKSEFCYKATRALTGVSNKTLQEISSNLDLRINRKPSRHSRNKHAETQTDFDETIGLDKQRKTIDTDTQNFQIEDSVFDQRDDIPKCPKNTDYRETVMCVAKKISPTLPNYHETRSSFSSSYSQFGPSKFYAEDPAIKQRSVVQFITLDPSNDSIESPVAKKQQKLSSRRASTPELRIATDSMEFSAESPIMLNANRENRKKGYALQDTNIEQEFFTSEPTRKLAFSNKSTDTNSFKLPDRAKSFSEQISLKKSHRKQTIENAQNQLKMVDTYGNKERPKPAKLSIPDYGTVLPLRNSSIPMSSTKKDFLEGLTTRKFKTKMVLFNLNNFTFFKFLYAISIFQF